MAAGSALAAAASGGSTTVIAFVVTGLVAGTTAITANVIIDTEAGHVIFALSGALVVAVITGAVSRWIVGQTSVPDISGSPAVASKAIVRSV